MSTELSNVGFMLSHWFPSDQFQHESNHDRVKCYNITGNIHFTYFVETNLLSANDMKTLALSYATPFIFTHGSNSYIFASPRTSIPISYFCFKYNWSNDK